MTNKTIYLLRHGKIAVDGEQRRYIGQADVPLADEGIKQAERLRTLLSKTGFAAIYCSDLVRSHATAKIISKNSELAPVVMPELREINLGEWEGRTFAEIARSYPEQFESRGRDIAYYRTPGGESFAECSSRAKSAFQNILTATGETAVVVGHAGVNRVILCHILGAPLANLFRIGQDFACINILQYTGNTGRIKALNWTIK